MITLSEPLYPIFAWRDPASTLGIKGHAVDRKVVKGELVKTPGSYVVGRIIELDEEDFDKLVDDSADRGMILSSINVFSEDFGGFVAFYTVKL